MAEEPAPAHKMSMLEKIMELLGVADPRGTIERAINNLAARTSELDLNQGSFDVQAMYSELDKFIRKEIGLEKITEQSKTILHGLVERIKYDDLITAIKSLKIKDNVAKVDKALEALNLHARYQEAKTNLERSGVPDAGARLKKVIEESMVQERLDAFEDYLREIGVEEPRKKMEELLDALGLKGAFDDLRSIAGWDRVDAI
jgi:hypothetical protein